MAVPSLPLINTPCSVLFHVLDVLSLLFLFVLYCTTVVSLMVLTLFLHIKFVICVRTLIIPFFLIGSCRTARQCWTNSCSYKCMDEILSAARLLCVNTFPALFKKHKTRSGDSQTREFMVLLDRKVENNLVLVAAFCFTAFSIFCSSAMLFVRYFPVDSSKECLEKDSHDRPVFCFINASLTNPSCPVDCANYSVTELRELDFECYAIGGLGIAVAAALGLAKVNILFVTIFVKVSEAFFKRAKNKKWNPKCAYILYTIVSIVIHLVFIASLFFMHIFTFEVTTSTNGKLLLRSRYFLAYVAMFLPLLIVFSMLCIMVNMKAHCDKGEYTSFAADQRPLDSCNDDEELESSVTERQHEGACNRGSIIKYRVATGETDETLRINDSDNTECTYGAAQS